MRLDPRHELTNLFGTFVIGVFGPSLGIPARHTWVDRCSACMDTCTSSVEGTVQRDLDSLHAKN